MAEQPTDHTSLADPDVSTSTAVDDTEQNTPLDVGDEAPGFELHGTQDGEIQTYSLSALTDDGAVLMGVYPMDFDEVCTMQMCQLTDMEWYQYKLNLSVIGVNTHGPFSHMAFADEEDIEIPLLCDTGGSMLESYGVLYDEYMGFERVPQRSMFLIDSDGVVQFRWLAEDNTTESDFGINPVQEAIKQL